MGNTESNVASGVKKQAGVSTQAIYKLINLKGGGMLVDMMKRACQNKQFAELDHAIKTKVEPFLYNKGAGRYIPIATIVLFRNKERARHKLLPELRLLENPDDDFDINQHLRDVSEVEHARNPAGYREVCWDLNERGAVGESILHLCLLSASQLHGDLAKRLLRFYPKLINDIYMADEYYGENPLHIAIVNEDPAMVKYLLNVGADLNERCFGAFMGPEDQKASRSDSQEHEYVDVTPLTTYDGYMYLGEYPLSFAACLGLEECYRIVLSRGADPDAQDTNGNTVLHMLVIYEKQDTFDMAYEMGATLAMRNVLNMTPLTLASKLGRVEMFFHVMNIEREIYWQLGSVTCAAYPLEQIDTIDGETGNISKDSALNLVVFGDKDEHLELMDGVLIDLLKTKWNTFVKSRFYRQFYLFATYFVVSLVGFLLRPGPEMDDDDEEDGNEKAPLAMQNGTALYKFIALPLKGMITDHTESPFRYNATEYVDDADDEPTAWSSYADCPLTNVDTTTNQVRVVAELVLLCGAILYIAAALRESRFLGYNMFVENLVSMKGIYFFFTFK